MYLDFLHGSSNITLIKQHILHGHLADFDIIREQQLVNSLCGVSHKHTALKRSLQKLPANYSTATTITQAAPIAQMRRHYLLQEVRQRCGVVQVKAVIFLIPRIRACERQAEGRFERVRMLLGDEEDVYGGRIDLVEVGQRRHAGVRRVDAAVELAASQREEHSSAAVVANRRRGGDDE
jgi:hypothetical protein